MVSTHQIPKHQHAFTEWAWSHNVCGHGWRAGGYKVHIANDQKSKCHNAWNYSPEQKPGKVEQCQTSRLHEGVLCVLLYPATAFAWLLLSMWPDGASVYWLSWGPVDTQQEIQWRSLSAHTVLKFRTIPMCAPKWPMRTFLSVLLFVTIITVCLYTLTHMELSMYHTFCVCRCL